MRDIKFLKMTKKMIVGNKRAFTLLEVMICIFIITSVGSFVFFQIHKGTKKAYFSTSTKSMVNKLDFCKKMAFLHQADTYFRLYQTDKGILLTTGFEEKVFNRGQHLYKGLSFSYKGVKMEYLEIVFSSSGKMNPNAEFMLHQKNEQELISYQPLDMDQSMPYHPEDIQNNKVIE